MENIEKGISLMKKYDSLLKTYHVNTNLRKAHFFTQIEAESGLEVKAENMNYSPRRLTEVFPKYFPNSEIANFYAKSPAMIASRVYANRMGNGDEKSMEGHKYKGRGFMQITGKDNYLLLSKDSRIDFITNPDLLLEEPNAMIAALWYWGKRKLNALADQDRLDSISDMINIGHVTPKVGDAIGYKHRAELLTKWKKQLGV